MKKIIILTGLIILIALFFYFGLDQWLSFDNLKQQQASINTAIKQDPVTITLLYFIGYVIVTTLSLPGALIMTLAGGALFGLIYGTIVVSFASSIGATLAFLVSRYFFRDTVQKRYGGKLKTINDGIKRDGVFYLFTLRLVPVFPFFLINLIMGLTPIKATSFYWVSQVGMLAGTIIYVNAGTQLSQLDSPGGILSPGLLFSFVLLGLFPLLARWVLRQVQSRRVYQQWQSPKQFDRNLIVIGAGAAGLVSAYIAATVKARVTLVEAHKMGGDCLNYGCVPSKALIKSARIAHQIKHADEYGLEQPDTRVNFSRIMRRIQMVICKVEPHDSIERYTKLGVEVLTGYARIINPWTVAISLANGETQQLTTRSIIIATGARPFIPPIPGISDVEYLTSDTLWEKFSQLEQIPERLVVLGGGPIGCELAQSLSRLGASVTQVERGGRILSQEDEDVSAIASNALERDGVTILTEHDAIRCERQGESQFIIVKQGDKEKQIPFDYLICATGRAARLDGFGLEELGIETQRTVKTNDFLETLYPNIYAAGDVAGPYQFTHTAAHQAWYAAVNSLFGNLKRFRVDYSVIPWTTFIDPEVAHVGLSEQEALSKAIPYETTRFGIDDLDRAIADGVDYGFIKVLTVPGKDRILGVTIVGEHAGDLLTEFVLAMKHGLGLNKILGTIHTYPTLSEANKYAAGEWKRNHAPEWAFKWLERYHNWRRG